VRHGIATLTTLVLVVAAGCGGSSPGPPTDTVADGTRVEADRYFADSAAGASAVRAFSREMATIVNPAGPNELKRLAPRLLPPLTQAKLVSQRLSAERLDDARLDQQRARRATQYQAVVAAMDQVTAAAEAGDAQGAQEATTTLTRAVGEMGERDPE
jgi:hypothetical protein